MSKKNLIPSTEEAWDNRELGADAEHAQVAPVELTSQIEAALGMQMISIRLPRDLIKAFKDIAAYHGIGYQPLMRDALERFANGEMRSIVSGVVESQKDRGGKHMQDKHPDLPTASLDAASSFAGKVAA